VIAAVRLALCVAPIAVVPLPGSTSSGAAPVGSPVERTDPIREVARLQETVAARPNDPAALAALAAAYGRLEDPRAEELYRRAVRIRPRDRSLRVGLAQLLWRAGRFDDGNAEMERALASSPPDRRLRIRYAEGLAAQSRFVQAARELERACRAGTCDVDTLEMWALALTQTGRFEEAAAAWSRAIQTDASRASSRYGLGQLLLLRGKPEAAERELAEAARLQADAAPIRVDLGRALEAEGRLADAERQYREALRLDPTLSRARYALGTVLAREGRGGEAREEIARYQSLFEREQELVQRKRARHARAALGWTKLRAGDAAAALDAFEGVGDDPAALRGRAAALWSLGRLEEAVRTLEQAVRLAPGDVALRWALIRAREGASP